MGLDGTTDLKLEDYGVLRRWYRRLYMVKANENCFEKTTNSVKLAGVTGGVVSFLDIAYYTRPTTYYEGAVRVAHFTLPAMGMALAYCSTLCVVSNMRNKEDSWNHTIAGMAAGTVLGAKKMNFNFGLGSSLALGVTAFLFKTAADEDWPIFNDNLPASREHLSIFHWKGKQSARQEQ